MNIVMLKHTTSYFIIKELKITPLTTKPLLEGLDMGAVVTFILQKGYTL